MKGACLLLPVEVLRAIEVFRARYGGSLNDPAFVRERCAELSDELAEDRRDGPLPARTVFGARFGEDARFPGIRLVLDGHFATLVPQHWEEAANKWVGELVVDWTVHQFTAADAVPILPVPWVTNLERWRAVWQQFLPAV